ncbi:MAG: hypothetical protein HC845_00450 [Akkermansiaceae bacterium]|nr:hypothetical protein [Akkermansiaceae bacterium]
MSPESSTLTFDKDQWMRALEDLATALGKEGPQTEVCLIGSAACIFAGMELRTTEDLDIWQPHSDFDIVELRNAAEKAGLSFNPQTILEPDKPYLQIVEPGIVQMGAFEAIRMFKIGRLIVSRPPIENIIASKLTRADAKDIDDVKFLQQHFQPDIGLIKKIILSFTSPKKEVATENLIYLEILQ